MSFRSNTSWIESASVPELVHQVQNKMREVEFGFERMRQLSFSYLTAAERTRWEQLDSDARRELFALNQRCNSSLRSSSNSSWNFFSSPWAGNNSADEFSHAISNLEALLNACRELERSSQETIRAVSKGIHDANRSNPTTLPQSNYMFNMAMAEADVEAKVEAEVEEPSSELQPTGTVRRVRSSRRLMGLPPT